MAGPERQFDPVASSAVSAVRTSDRVLRSVESNTPAPSLPNRSQATRTLRDGIASASTISPFNTLLGEGGPSPPDFGGGDSPDFLPASASDAPELPDPAGVFGGSLTLSDLAPQNLVASLTENGPMPAPGNGGGGGGNGGNGDANGGSTSGNGDANAPAPSRGSGASR